MHRVRPIIGLLQRNPDFARLYVALLIAFAADWFATVALIDLVLETTDPTAAASVILVLQMAPFLVATPIAGMLADRFDRRNMLAGANVARHHLHRPALRGRCRHGLDRLRDGGPAGLRGGLFRAHRLGLAAQPRGS